MPQVLGGGDLVQLHVCSVGYSNILFGVLMFYALAGNETHGNICGFRIKKAYVPFIYLIFCSLAVPEAAFSGHLCGILAALIIKYFGLYKLRLLP